MEIDQPLTLLGGLSAQQFMRRHWQKKPLLVRQAVPAMVPPIARPELFDLAAHEEVESRLIRHGKSGWTLKHGPFARRALPSLKQPGWTLLVQGVDLHHQGVHELLQQFRFVPDARLDDVMISYASDTGGVGPHFDSYDVFLLQAQGRRRWSIGKQGDLRLLFIKHASSRRSKPYDRRPRFQHGVIHIDADRAFEATREGRSMPLPQLERRVMPMMGGADYLGPEMNGDTYRFKFMQNGRVIWVDVDGQGRVLHRSRGH